jgi:hypothetical protein
VIGEPHKFGLSSEDVALLESGELAALLELEQKHGEALLDVHPELAEKAQALQRIRAAVAASELGLRLRGDGRPLPNWLVAELSRVLRRIVIDPDD